MKYYTGLILTMPTTAKVDEYTYDIYGDDTVMNNPFYIKNKVFIKHNQNFIAKEIEIGSHLSSLTYVIFHKGKEMGRVAVNPYTTAGKLSKATWKVTSGKVVITHSKIPVNKIDKKKFIVVCSGRGMGDHNQGDNFLNTAKNHILEIQKNTYPNIPKFDPNTCEIISHEDVFYMGGYYIFTEDALNKDGKPDGYKGKSVPVGELHRVSEFAKIFTTYSNIVYFAYFGHSWVNSTKEGVLYLGDRAIKGTNVYHSEVVSLSTQNVVSTAQFRFFGCQSSYVQGNLRPIAQLFAEQFRGREVYGWASSGGSIFTHDKNYGYTGINKTGKNPNTVVVNTNKSPAWLVANGKPEGWLKFKK